MLDKGQSMKVAFMGVGELLKLCQFGFLDPGGVMLGRLSSQLQCVENGVELKKVILDCLTRLHVTLDILRS